MRSFFSVFALVFVLSCGSTGFARSEGERGVRTFELKNGLKVFVVPEHRLPVAMHILTYKVGGVDDPSGLSGMAHFFEHLMFSGTEKYPDFAGTIEGLGGWLNAATGRESTVYFELVHKQYLPLIMAMEADRMWKLQLTDGVIERERNVVREERSMRVESTKQGILREEVESVFFHKSGYGTPVIGWEHEMANWNRAAVDSFYDEHYSPNNAILLVVGDVDVAQVFQLAEKYYGIIPNRNEGGKARLPVKVEPPYRSDIAVRLAHPSVSQPESLVLYRAPSFKTAPDMKTRVAAAVAADIVAGNGFGVLYDELVRGEGDAIEVSMSYSAGNGMVVLQITPRIDGCPEKLIREAKSIISRLLKEGVSEARVLNAKRRGMANLMYVLDGMDKAWFYAKLLAFGVELQSPSEYSEIFKSITVQDVNESLKSVFSGATVEAYLISEAGEGRCDDRRTLSPDVASVEVAQ